MQNPKYISDQKTMTRVFDPSEFEHKWQKIWEQENTFSPDITASTPSGSEAVKQSKIPYYNLMMFPYPSAEGLHVGNMYAFTGADVYAKFNRMQGKDVLEPIGLDGFGIHSENYALKVGRHPMEQAEIAEKNFYRQLRSIGNSFDWQRTVETYDPSYYKWTQWLFVKLFKAGLAYRDVALVNWCPKDMTVLSDEQVIDGCCERCGTKVEKKNLEQWFFRITKYADRLLNNIEKLDWSNKVKIAQTNWIGKSEGAEIEFVIASEAKQSKDKEIATSPTAPRKDVIKVFTTRPDTLYGATFMAVAPEHELVAKMLAEASSKKQELREIREYIEKTKNKTDIERMGEGKDKTGVFSGLYVINPVNGEKIPVWIADYVLSSYGTGAIMAVPAHDERDFAFAKKYELPIVEVIENQESRIMNHRLEEAYEGDGKLINSGEWNGLEVPREMSKVLDWLENKGLGVRKANFHLRDWLISRQRYWGPPIPMIFCQNCADNSKNWFETNRLEFENINLENPAKMDGWFPVPEAQLPVLLPDVEDWRPEGTQSTSSGQAKGPLANHPEFYKTTCPSCGGEAVRETDVSDTFLDSSWYFLRYPSTDIENAAFDIEITKKWLPVNMYIGGAEHSVLHLLYSRFITMVLRDLNYLNFEEPFSTFFAHGLIVKDGAKMSKSKGNVVVPDEYIAKYGADTLRTYLMFLGPYSEGGDFRDSGIEGMYRFLRKVWKLLLEQGPVVAPPPSDNPQSQEFLHPSDVNLTPDRLRMMHKTIKDLTRDITEFGYNTAIAKLMEWYNYLSEEVRGKKKELSRQEREAYLKLLAPFAPHMTEELWQEIQNQESSSSDNSKFNTHNSIHFQKWPEFEEKYLVSDTIIIPVQINGKRRGEIEVGMHETGDRSQVEKMAHEAVFKQLSGLEIKKVIYVTGKILNFVV